MLCFTSDVLKAIGSDGEVRFPLMSNEVTETM